MDYFSSPQQFGSIPMFLSFSMVFLMAGTTYSRLDFRRFFSSGSVLRNVDFPGKIFGMVPTLHAPTTSEEKIDFGKTFGTSSALHTPKKNDEKNAILETRNRQTGPDISVFYKVCVGVGEKL